MENICIVRAYANEPVKMFFRKRKNYIEVSKNNTYWIGWPRRFIYEFDGDVYAKLKAEFEKVGSMTVDSLWQKLRYLN